MASVYSITTEGEEALAAATAETLLQLRGHANTKAKIIEIGVSFDGVSTSEAPVVVRLLRQTTDGTSTGATEIAWDPDNPTPLCTGFHSHTSTEPTAGDVLATWEVHPQGGSLVVQWPLGREPTLDNATTSRIGLEVNAPAAVNAVAYMVWEE
jgi:hypothetical protein